MKIEWIIKRLKVSGKGTKQEVLNALENATADDLRELGCSALAQSTAMTMFGVKRYCDTPMCKEDDKQSDTDWDKRTDAQV